MGKEIFFWLLLTVNIFSALGLFILKPTPVNGVRWSDIKSAFDDYSLTKQVFNCNGQTLKDSSGESVFYGAWEIDGVIEKINKLKP